MEYLPNLCFAGFNSKRRKIQQERREKQQLQQCMSRLKFVCRDNLLSNYQRNHVATTFLVSQHHNLIVDNRARLLQKTVGCGREWEKHMEVSWEQDSLCCDIMLN